MWNKIKAFFEREPNLSTMIADLEAQRSKVETGAKKLASFAATKKAEADALAKRAQAQQQDAHRAQRIADRFADLIK